MGKRYERLLALARRVAGLREVERETELAKLSLADRETVEDLLHVGRFPELYHCLPSSCQHTVMTTLVAASSALART